jgi:hypothetical protein
VRVFGFFGGRGDDLVSVGGWIGWIGWMIPDGNVDFRCCQRIWISGSATHKIKYAALVRQQIPLKARDAILARRVRSRQRAYPMGSPGELCILRCQPCTVV